MKIERPPHVESRRAVAIVDCRWMKLPSGNAWEDPDFLAPFEGKGTGITTEENNQVSITLKLIPTDKFQQSPERYEIRSGHVNRYERVMSRTGIITIYLVLR